MTHSRACTREHNPATPKVRTGFTHETPTLLRAHTYSPSQPTTLLKTRLVNVSHPNGTVTPSLAINNETTAQPIDILVHSAYTLELTLQAAKPGYIWLNSGYLGYEM